MQVQTLPAAVGWAWLGTGFAIFSQTGLKTVQVGCQFTLRCRFEEEISYATFN